MRPLFHPQEPKALTIHNCFFLGHRWGFSGLIAARLDDLKSLWKISDSHLLEHSSFSGRKRIGLGDWRQIFAPINLVQGRYALHPGSWLTTLHREAELGFGPTTAGCFNAESRELALRWTRQAITVRLIVLEHQKCDGD